MDSLKIEGRAKTFYYVASVTAAYRKALDQYLADPFNDNFELSDDVLAELTRTSHRHYSPGFYFGREQARQAKMCIRDRPSSATPMPISPTCWTA